MFYRGAWRGARLLFFLLTCGKMLRLMTKPRPLGLQWYQGGITQNKVESFLNRFQKNAS